MDNKVTLGSVWKRKCDGWVFKVVEVRPFDMITIFNEERSLMTDMCQKVFKINYQKEA